MEFADIEIDPAHFVFGAAFGDQDHLGLDDAGIADEPAARLDDRIRQVVAEMLAQRLEDRLAVGFELRRLAHVARRETAAEIDDGKADAALGASAEDRRRRSERAVPGFHIVLLRADVEGNAMGDEAALWASSRISGA